MLFSLLIEKLFSRAYDMGTMGYTAKEAAELIGCSVATVSRWCKTFGLSHKKHGYAMTLTKADVEKIERAWKKQPGRPFAKESGNNLR